MIVVSSTGKRYYLDNKLRMFLDWRKQINAKKKWTLVIIDGAFGSGKSTLTSQVSDYCCPLLLSDYGFTLEGYRKLTQESIYRNVILDEAVGLKIAHHQSKIYGELIADLWVCRHKQQFHWLCINSFWELPYDIVKIAKGLIHLDYHEGADGDKAVIDQGTYRFYPEHRIKQLYGQKFFIRNPTKWRYIPYEDTFQGYFNDVMIVDSSEYESAKIKALMSKNKDVGCPSCGSISKIVNRNGTIRCRKCSYVWTVPNVSDVASQGISKIDKVLHMGGGLGADKSVTNLS